MIVRIGDERGFTLTELLVAMAVLGVIMAGVMTFIWSGQHSYSMGAGKIEAQQNMRVALDLMIREIRDAGNDPSKGGFPAIVSTGGAGMPTAAAFRIQNDWNGNGIIEPAVTTNVGGVLHGEQIDYTIVGNLLQRREWGIDNAPQTLIAGLDFTGIAIPAFQYQDSNAAPAANANAIAAVLITLQTRPVVLAGTTATTGLMRYRADDMARIRNR